MRALVKQKSSTLGGYARRIITLIALIWLILGIFAGTSPKIASKILQWNYIFAWILLFGFPCTFLLWLGLHGTCQKTKIASNKKSENDVMAVEDSKTKEKKSADMVYVENIHFVPTKPLQNNDKQARILVHSADSPEQLQLEEFSETKICHHCHAIISEDEYERYGGLCHGCYIDFKRELRRSGLFGADRASTW